MPRISGLTDTTVFTTDSIDRKPRRTNSWETKNAIVYDVSSQELIQTERKAIECRPPCQRKLESISDVATADHTRIKIPKRPLSPLQKDNVRISMPLNSTAGSDVLAEVKLSSLGFKIQFERYRGNIDEIWVKGIPQYII